MYFWQKSEGVINHDRNFDITKSSPHPCATLSGRMVFVSSFSSEKNQLQFGKKWKQFKKKIFTNLIAQKNPDRKNFDVILSLKRSLHKPRKINATMNPIFGLGYELEELK